MLVHGVLVHECNWFTGVAGYVYYNITLTSNIKIQVRYFSIFI